MVRIYKRAKTTRYSGYKKAYKKPVRKYSRKVVRASAKPTLASGITTAGAQRIQRFTRTSEDLITVPASGGTVGVKVYKLSDMPGYADFTTLYDVYRIKRIYVTFVPPSIMTAKTDAALFRYAVDLNDLTNPTKDIINTYESVRKFNITNGLSSSFSFQPAANYSLTGNVATSSTGSVLSPWINTSSPDIQHYGIKYVADSGSNIANIKVLITWVIECKGMI